MKFGRSHFGGSGKIASFLYFCRKEIVKVSIIDRIGASIRLLWMSIRDVEP